MKTFRVIFDQLELPSDFIGDAQCPSCGDDDRRADYGETCRFCGQNTYQPCLEVPLTWFAYDTAVNQRRLESLSVGDELELSGAVCRVIRLT